MYVPKYVEPSRPCACGGVATYQRLREGTTQSVLGAVRLKRPYYLCAACHQGSCPLDATLGFCAGGSSAGLQEVMAVVGVEFPFEAAAAVLHKTEAVVAKAEQDAT